jgi:hypothetical protein
LNTLVGELEKGASNAAIWNVPSQTMRLKIQEKNRTFANIRKIENEDHS